MEYLLRWWCRLVHKGIMFPGGREYECKRCGRRFVNPGFNEVGFYERKRMIDGSY